MRPDVSSAATLEDAAEIVARRLHDELPDSTPLVRMYALVAHDELPEDVRAFVAALAERTVGGESSVAPTTPVLSLLGTYG